MGDDLSNISSLRNPRPKKPEPTTDVPPNENQVAAEELRKKFEEKKEEARRRREEAKNDR
jgi:hypothetical protein